MNYQQIRDRLLTVESVVVSNGSALANSRIGQYLSLRLPIERPRTLMAAFHRPFKLTE